VGDTRQRVTRWMQEAPSFLEMVAHVVDDRQRAFDVADACERECERLRGELASALAEIDGLRRDQVETADVLAEVLGKAGDALRRLRAAPGAEPAVRDHASAEPAVASPADRGQAEGAARPFADRAPAQAEPVAVHSPEPAEAPAEPTVTSAAPESRSIPAPAARPPAAGARRILLVDDDANFRNVMTEYLEGFRGYDLRVAVSGEEGLAALADAVPDIVLLDLMMPGIGGMVTLEQMKSECPDLPVVMVTANEDLSLARKALSLGACDYVTKPFDLDYLDAVLNIYLSKTDPRRERELEVLAGVDGGAVTAVTRTIKSYFSRR